MTLIHWTPAPSVGVARFDDQPKVLVGLVDDLHAALADGKGDEVVTFLTGWLTHHVLGEDAKYGPFLQGRGAR